MLLRVPVAPARLSAKRIRPSWAQTVIDLCRDRDWTQNDLALKARVRPNTLSSILLGHTSPRLDTLEKLASGFGVPLWRLFVDEDQAQALERQREADEVQDMAKELRSLIRRARVVVPKKR